jgi:hypothetical protein
MNPNQFVKSFFHPFQASKQSLEQVVWCRYSGTNIVPHHRHSTTLSRHASGQPVSWQAIPLIDTISQESQPLAIADSPLVFLASGQPVM